MTLAFEFQDGAHSKHGLSSLQFFPPVLLGWNIWSESTASKNNKIFRGSHPKTPGFCCSTLMLMFTGAAVSPEKGAAPCFCITQKINEASSCRETSLFKVHRCSRKQQFSLKKVRLRGMKV